MAQTSWETTLVSHAQSPRWPSRLDDSSYGFNHKVTPQKLEIWDEIKFQISNLV